MHSATRFIDSLDVWNYFFDTIHDYIVKLPSDTSVVASDYNGRLDLLAHSFYENPLLWWIIAEYNSILDPIDFSDVSVLYIPNKDDVTEMLSSLKAQMIKETL